jgi:SAM-dependent methyltransferase
MRPNWRVLRLLRKLLRPAKNAYKRLTLTQGSREEVQRYWRTPPDQGNLPESYFQGAARSTWLVELVRQHLALDPDRARILEIGCNVGRNLDRLFAAGYRDLTGIEINEDAVRLLRLTFPGLAAAAKIHVGPVEEKINAFADGEFDLLFTMAVLEHIHEDSAWIFAEMARATKGLLITVEDEREFSQRHFPRDYERIFTALGLRQVQSLECSGIEGLGPGFFARVFRKESPARGPVRKPCAAE